MAESLLDLLQGAFLEDRPTVLATVVAGPQKGAKIVLVGPDGADDSSPDVEPRSAGWTDDGLEQIVQRDAEAALASGATSVRRYGEDGRLDGDTHEVFYEAFVPQPRLIIFGALDFTAALARVAKVLGYHVVVCDARATFATEARFPLADDIVVDWPDRYLGEVGPLLGPRDAVCVLSHDAKFDVPALAAALDTEVGYIGAMGSRRTTEDRADRLRKAGVSDEGLERVRAPIGLDLGARSPEETAVAICAEIIAAQTGRLVPSLKDTAGPIHADAPDP